MYNFAKICGNSSHIRWLIDVEIYFPEFEPSGCQRVFGLQLFQASTENEHMTFGLYVNDLRTSFVGGRCRVERGTWNISPAH